MRSCIWLSMVLTCVAGAQEADRVAPAAPQPAPSGLLGLWPAAPLMGEFRPMTAGDKFRLAMRDSVDPVTFGLAGASAGIAQASDTHPALGQGAAGFGKRWATSYADYAINYAMTEAAFPALLHQDHRYFRRGSGGFGSRVAHAVSRTFVTYSDSGRQVFNASEIGGDLVSVGISTAYYSDDRSIGTVAGRWGVYVGYNMAANVVKEFWPDIVRKLQRK